jgi:hypothetical protein
MRSPGVASYQASKAVLAAATALSTSSALPSATSPSTSPVAGLTIVRVLPLTESTHLPFTNIL